MKYIIYDRYENAKALLTSTGELFGRLQLEVIKPKDSLLDCGGYFARFVQKDVLLRNVAYNLALANSLNATLVFLEEDAYANALYAKTLIESDSELMRDIEQQFLHRFNLLYDSKVQMSYLPDLLNTINFESLIQKRFSPFSSIIVRGAYQGHLPKSTNHGLYKKIDLTMLENPIALQYYAHLLQGNSQSALYNSARLFFDLADLGIDFILTHSLSQLRCWILNELNFAERIIVIISRCPLCFCPKFYSLLLSKNDPKKLGFNYHQQKVEMF